MKLKSFTHKLFNLQINSIINQQYINRLTLRIGTEQLCVTYADRIVYVQVTVNTTEMFINIIITKFIIIIILVPPVEDLKGEKQFAKKQHLERSSFVIWLILKCPAKVTLIKGWIKTQIYLKIKADHLGSSKVEYMQRTNFHKKFQLLRTKW